MIASTLPVLKATPLLADSGSLMLGTAGLAQAQIATTKRAEVLPLVGLFSDLWNMPRKQARIQLYQLIQLQDACQARAANIFASPEAGLASGFFLFYQIRP
ncbi:MAG TPA: hypothetical protein VFN35_09000 [Ktedonobacteraceae bacterium]|nr:hypothetical protein [Ktedonobacteraceae bacterium]